MLNSARELKMPNAYEIKLAENDLITKLNEAAKYSDKECADYKIFSKQLREKTENGNV